MALIDKIKLKRKNSSIEEEYDGRTIDFRSVIVGKENNGESINGYSLFSFFEDIKNFFSQNMFQYYFLKKDNESLELKKNVIECYVVEYEDSNDFSDINGYNLKENKLIG